MIERTLALLKPDATRRELNKTILNVIQKNNFDVVKFRIVNNNKNILEEHYKEHKGKPFFNSLLEYMSNGKIIAIILEKENAIKDWRKLMGATNPKDADKNTIRGMFGIAPEPGKNIENLVHGSDSYESAKREIELWFPGQKDNYLVELS